MFGNKETRKKKRAIKQNWKLLRGLKCAYCLEANKGRCKDFCQLLLLQTKERERELDSAK